MSSCELSCHTPTLGSVLGVYTSTWTVQLLRYDKSSGATMIDIKKYKAWVPHIRSSFSLPWTVHFLNALTFSDLVYGEYTVNVFDLVYRRCLSGCKVLVIINYVFIILF